MRKSKHYIIKLLLLSLLFCTGCKEDAVESQPEENDPQVQNAPQLVLPQNNSTTNNPEQLLQWNGLSEAVSYRVQLSTDANFISSLAVDTSLIGTSLNLRNGDINTSVYYYWRVIAGYANSTFSPWSAVWRFRLILAPPPAPVLLSPANNSTNVQFNPLFDWENAPTAQYYNFQLSQSQSFTSLLLNQQQIQISEYQCPPFVLEQNSLYFWRVNASNSNGISIGAWSQIFSFTTVNSPEPGSISGTVRFTDTNFTPLPAYYIAGAYTLSTWPPAQQVPLKFDSLIIRYVNNQYIADYRIRALQQGEYIIAVLMYDQLSTNSVVTMGVFGCDTARTLFSGCALNSPTLVNVGTNQGVTDINFLCWADTSKRIFQ